MERNDFMRPVEIREPEMPQARNFATRKEVDQVHLSMARTPEARHRLFQDLKRQASRELADFIFKHCKFFEVTDPAKGEMLLQLEVSINDRGAYENWLPVAEQRGKAAGRAQATRQMVESLPYGLADAASEFYAQEA